MARFLRSKKLRAALWIHAGGKCQQCGKPLGADWHADHIVPWSVTKRTNVHEMQALCPECNLKKGANMFFDRTKYRPGQAAGHAAIIDRAKDREPCTSIVLPTRYGKSDLIRTTALAAKESRIVYGSLVVTPYVNLVNQICSERDVRAMAIRYGIPYEKARLINTINPSAINYFSNDEYLVACTMQAATRARDIVAMKAESVKKTTGLPLLVFIDECHQTSQQKVRGDFVKAVTAAGGLLVLLTATAVRADGEIIPGFDVEVLDEKDHRKYVVTDKGDGKNNTVNVYEGVRKLVRLKANHETTFKDAWNERPSPLCRLSREAIDVSIDMPDKASKKLSELSLSECGRYISICSRMDRVVRDGVVRMLSDLASRRKVREDIAAIVFTGNDEAADERDNHHAKLVKKIIADEQKNFGLKLNVVIATMKNEERDEAAEKKIDDFRLHNKGDVLIVKQMGGAGLDVGRVKVVLDLSTVRTVASCMQRYMRAATPYEGIKTATIIGLKDARAEAIWQKCIVEAGGSVEHWHGTDYEWKREYDVPKGKDEDQDQIGSIGDLNLGSLDDSDGNWAEPECYAGAAFLIERFPELLTARTKAEIAGLISDAPFSLGSSPPIGTQAILPVEISNEQKRFNDLTSQLASRDAGSYGTNKEAWTTSRRKYVNLAKKQCGVGCDIELKCITNIKTLRAMVTFLEREVGYGKSKAD